MATTTAQIALPLKLTATDQVDTYVQSLGYREITMMRGRAVDGHDILTVTSRRGQASEIVDAIRARFL